LFACNLFFVYNLLLHHLLWCFVEILLDMELLVNCNLLLLGLVVDLRAELFSFADFDAVVPVVVLLLLVVLLELLLAEWLQWVVLAAFPLRLPLPASTTTSRLV
jgi:hypothetical protein